MRRRSAGWSSSQTPAPRSPPSWEPSSCARSARCHPGSSRPLGAEQSNSSVVVGGELLVKLYRRLEPGINPELELLRFLSDRQIPSVPKLLGWWGYTGSLLETTLGIFQRFVPGAKDGWSVSLELLESDPEGFVAEARVARRGDRRSSYRPGGRDRGRGLRARGAEARGDSAAHCHGRRRDRAGLRPSARSRSGRVDRRARGSRARPARLTRHRRPRRAADPASRRPPPWAAAAGGGRLVRRRLRGRASALGARAAREALAAPRRRGDAPLLCLRDHRRRP